MTDLPSERPVEVAPAEPAPLQATPLADVPAEVAPAAEPEPTELADRVAAAARAVPGVTDLHAGAFGEVATYLPGRRVSGVRLGERVTEVHVVVSMGTPVLPAAESIRAAVQPLVTTPVDVYVEDVDQSDAG